MTTGGAAVIEAVRERFAPGCDTFEDAVRQGRRALTRGQHVAEDAAVAAARRIRHRPFTAVAMAAGAGAFAGIMAGFAIAWVIRR
jgi:ElaB/YqjD/DUF883 family membrane-anchored ribosome-binding protein